MAKGLIKSSGNDYSGKFKIKASNARSNKTARVTKVNSLRANLTSAFERQSIVIEGLHDKKSIFGWTKDKSMNEQLELKWRITVAMMRNTIEKCCRIALTV